MWMTPKMHTILLKKTIAYLLFYLLIFVGTFQHNLELKKINLLTIYNLLLEHKLIPIKDKNLISK